MSTHFPLIYLSIYLYICTFQQARVVLWDFSDRNCRLYRMQDTQKDLWQEVELDASGTMYSWCHILRVVSVLTFCRLSVLTTKLLIWFLQVCLWTALHYQSLFDFSLARHTFVYFCLFICITLWFTLAPVSPTFPLHHSRLSSHWLTTPHTHTHTRTHTGTL